MSEARRTSRWFGIFFLLPTFLVKNHEIPRQLCRVYGSYRNILVDSHMRSRTCIIVGSSNRGMPAMVYITRQICMDGLWGYGMERQIQGGVVFHEASPSAVIWACCRINLMARMCSILGALKWSVRADG